MATLSAGGKRLGRPPGKRAPTDAELAHRSTFRERMAAGQAAARERRAAEADLPPPIEAEDGEELPRPEAVGRFRAPKAEPSRAPAPAKIGAGELTALVVGMFGGLAELPNQDHWRIEASEAEALTVPLARWLASKSAAAKWTAEHANTVLLLSGAVAVLTPRVILSARRGFKRGHDEHEDGRRAGRATPANPGNPLARGNTSEPVDIASRRGAREGRGEHAEGPDRGDSETVNHAVASSLGRASSSPLF